MAKKGILIKGNIKLSSHAIKRYDERFHKKLSELRRTAKNAFYNGVGYKSPLLNEPLRKYIQSKYRKYKNCEIRIHGDATFIFINNKRKGVITLKTVLRTPEYFLTHYSLYKKAMAMYNE